MTATTQPMKPLPVGTVTFLRTDVEGSMAMAHAARDRWDAINGAHLDRIREAVDAAGGIVVRTEGDATFAAFAEAGAAVEAAVAAQRSLATLVVPDDLAIRVRMGLHSGEAHLAGDDYGGFDVNRAARIAAAAHGGQVVLSETTTGLVEDRLPPGTRLRDLGRHLLRDVPRAERISQLEIDGLPTDFPPLRTAGTTIGNLHHRLTSFVGRDRDLADLEAIARNARVITLTGPGGIGKTSLAVELARLLEPTARDGVWFVALDAIDDPTLVASTVARTLGLFDSAGRPAADALAAHVADREILLVLDNVEHVIEAAPLVPALIEAAPGLRVIASSRAPLRIRGEHEYPVRSLGVDGLEDSASRLFTERARAVRPDFDPTADSQTIDDICRLLDGVPLGIELAAARVGSLPLAMIRDRLTARLPLPGSGPRDAPERQRTLDAAVAWSHDLLDAASQAVLHDLAVFEGGFDLEQADEVAGGGGVDALETLVRLADSSLIAPMPGHPGPRYRMLRSIQTFALGRLASSGLEHATRVRHATAFLRVAETAAPRLTTADQPPWMDRLATDDANLRVAVKWAIEADEAELAMRLVASLWRYWQITGQLARMGGVADTALALPAAQAASTARMWALAARGSIAYWSGDSVAAKRDYEEQQRLARVLGDEAGMADAVFNLGHVAFIDDATPDVLRTYVDEAARRFGDLGDERGAGRARWGYGTIAMTAGQHEEAETFFTEALDGYRERGDAQYLAMTEGSLAWVKLMRGDFPGAVRWAVQGIGHTHAMRDVATTAISLHVAVLIALEVGQLEDAVRLSGAFHGLCERYGVQPPASLGRLIKELDPIERARASVTPEVFDRRYAEGRRMTLDEAVALLTDLGEPADPGAAVDRPDVAGA